MNNKDKGSQFERDFARELSLVWSGGKNREVFWRTSSSGAKGTITKTTSYAFVGDICQVNFDYPEFPYIVELKRRKKFDLLSLFNKKSDVNKWLCKLVSEQSNLNKYILLVIKPDYRPAIIITDKILEGFNYLLFDKYQIALWKDYKRHI